MFRLWVRVDISRGSPKTGRQTLSTSVQAHYRSPNQTLQNWQNMTCVGNGLGLFMGHPWWTFMGADGYSGIQMRVGGQKGGRHDHEWSLREGATHDRTEQTARNCRG